MKIKVGRRFFRIRKLRLRTCPLPLRFPKLIQRLFSCMRSKISFFKSGHMKIQILERPLTQVVPQGCVAVHVGEEQKRYVIPIVYLYHPFITKLLKETEKEFGFHHQGLITVPCSTDDFEQILWLIDREKSS
ncbi:auxin-responsive protein SAUR21 [Cryptomeria japonica]|uniref:auxin-responsive protein SAUR21 n=1 Tax=Cryptomeria japonica TaxID=3369 RepID=UPI0025AC7736|nr:auxin-responsive protein SAUR21 [Cryptomeria japonica]